MTGVNFDITESSLNAQALATLNTQLSAQSEQLRSLAFVDGLTGVANRRHFDENLHAEWRRSRRDRVPLAMLMIDIDHFKLYNDQYGHQAGDVCLQAVARVLKESFGRSHDMVARYGGEEFACLLPASGMDGALAKAEELRAAVENLHIGHKSSPVAPVVTISVGVAAIVPDAEAHPDQLLAAADTALYAAKRDGRNRVCRSA
jgi:diguanylate cyclase (GGDEF)-like protein